MGLAGVTIEIMPESPETDFEKLKEKLQSVLSKNEAKLLKDEVEPIAFGLKKLIIIFQWDEAKESEEIVKEVGQIEGIRSCSVTDVRRMIQ